MKKAKIHQSLLSLLAVAWFVSATALADDKPAASEAEDYKRFLAVAQSQNIFADRTEAQMKADATALIEVAEAFLKAHPTSPKAIGVKFSAAQSCSRLWRLESDAKYKARGKELFQQILESKPDDDMVFQVLAFGLDFAETPEEIAKEVDAIATRFPNHDQTPEVLAYLATVYQVAGDIKSAMKTARNVVEKYPKTTAAKMSQELLDKLSFINQSPELRFTDVNGKTVDLKDFRGKVVLLDFWATWCGPCIAELPNVQKTYDQFHGKGFEIIGISLDRSTEAAQKFIADRKLAWPQLVDEKGELKKQFRVAAIPATFLLNREGKVVKTDLRGEALAKAVQELLEQK